MDCLDGLQQLPTASVPLIFADPPFNLGIPYAAYRDRREREEYIAWLESWLAECCRVLTETGSIYVMNSQENLWIAQAYLERAGFRFRNVIVWKNSSIPVKNRYCINYQPILFCTKSDRFTFNFDAEQRRSSAKIPGGKENNGGRMIDQWNDIPFVSGGCMASKEAILMPQSKRKAHPCQMPVRLAERIVRFSSNPGDLVLDPFMGSGTTAEAALRLGRQYLGFEIDPVYYELAVARLARVAAQARLS